MTHKKIKKILEDIDSCFILMHSNPDIDCIASAYVLLLYYLKQGKKVFIGIEKPLYTRYLFLIDPEKLCYFISMEEALKKDFEWVICLDTSAISRLGKFISYLEIKESILVIDHHYSFEPFGTINFNIPDASSTCEMIYDIFQGKFDNNEMAVSTYAGMVYDTGNFRYSSTTGNLLRKAADLIDHYKIDTNRIYYYIFENDSLVRKKLISMIISTIETYENGEVIITYFPKEFRKKLNIQDESDAIDLVFIGNSIKGCLFSIFIREYENLVHLSFRTSTEFNVADLANKWGGGGHKKAAGLNLMNYTFDYVKKEVVREIIHHYKEWRGKNA